MNFLKLTIELQKEKAVYTTSYQMFSKIQYCSPFSGGCMLYSLCWDRITKIANLVYPQNQCNPEAVDETTGAPRL